MLKEQLLSSLKKAGFNDKIISAFSNVKREDFIPENVKGLAYSDIALPIGSDQTISQPSTIALMLSLLHLNKGQKVLEIGSGSGYVLSLMSEIVGEKGLVCGVEILRDIYNESKKSLRPYTNVRVYCQDGKEGLKFQAPFDRILISAALETIPQAILNQLKDQGILVAPVGGFNGQSIVGIRRHGSYFNKFKEIPGFVFVRFV